MSPEIKPRPTNRYQQLRRQMTERAAAPIGEVVSYQPHRTRTGGTVGGLKRKHRKAPTVRVIAEARAGWVIIDRIDESGRRERVTVHHSSLHPLDLQLFITAPEIDAK